LFGLKSSEGASISIGKRKLALSTLAAFLLVVVVLFGGASATAYASQSALPGDALYPVKTSLEQTQITLANDAYNQAQLHLEFAQRRLDEIKTLLAQGRTQDVGFASNEFEHYIQEAMEASQIVVAADAARGAELTKLVSQALLDYASTLKSVLVAAPESVKPIVENAMMASQDGAGEELEIFGVVAAISETEINIDGVIYSIVALTEFKDFIQPGDMVKVHVIKTDFGALVIREIELSDVNEDDSTGSGDDSSNGSSGGNENENESDDDLHENESDDDLDEDESHENGSEDENESDDHPDEDGSNGDDDEHESVDNSSGSSSSGEDNEDKSNEDDDDSEEEDKNEDESSEDDNEDPEEEDDPDDGD
jgi:hypothetical protein